jgi:hypothetical protein
MRFLSGRCTQLRRSSVSCKAARRRRAERDEAREVLVLWAAVSCGSRDHDANENSQLLEKLETRTLVERAKRI